MTQLANFKFSFPLEAYVSNDNRTIRECSGPLLTPNKNKVEIDVTLRYALSYPSLNTSSTQTVEIISDRRM